MSQFHVTPLLPSFDNGGSIQVKYHRPLEYISFDSINSIPIWGGAQKTLRVFKLQEDHEKRL